MLKRTKTFLMLVLFMFFLSSCEQKTTDSTFTQWTPGAPAIESLQDYVQDVSLVASGQDGQDGLNYAYTEDDVLKRGDVLLAKNVKMNKVTLLKQELEQQPILAFGNSSGDASMMTYTIANNPYKSKAFLVVNDDMQREYGNLEKSTKMKMTAAQQGWTTISMRDDFKTIYGKNVTKSFADD